MTDTRSFDYADRKIKRLLNTFNSKLCGCCAARALLFNGASLLEGISGSCEAAETLEGIAADLRERNKPAPEEASGSDALH